MKTKNINIIRFALTVVIFFILISITWQMGWRDEEYMPLNILASREPELGIKIYAQFNVSQKIVLDRMKATKLVIPMYIPEKIGQTEILLKKGEDTVHRWELDSHGEEQATVQEIVLEFPENTWLEGTYTLTLDGREVSSEAQNEAVIVFVEKDDRQYPAGNYRVANNEKSGDISLRIMAERPVWERYWQKRETSPSRFYMSLIAYGIVFLIMLAMPRVLWPT